MGSAHPLNAPYQAFETADGWIVVGGANHRNWLRMLDAIGAPELAEDPRFLDNAARMANLAALEAELAERLRARNAKHWLEALEERGVPCGPVHPRGLYKASPIPDMSRGRDMRGPGPGVRQPRRARRFRRGRPGD